MRSSNAKKTGWESQMSPGCLEWDFWWKLALKSSTSSVHRTHCARLVCTLWLGVRLIFKANYALLWWCPLVSFSVKWICGKWNLSAVQQKSSPQTALSAACSFSPLTFYGSGLNRCQGKAFCFIILSYFRKLALPEMSTDGCKFVNMLLRFDHSQTKPLLWKAHFGSLFTMKGFRFFGTVYFF